MDTTKLDDLLNQAEEQEVLDNEWVLDLKYETKDFYVDEHGAVEIKNKTIGDMSNHVSVKGESYSQYVEFKMNRYYDGVDLTKMTLAIYFDIPNIGSDENRPINVYYNEREIKFGWAVPVEVSQVNVTIDLCIYARGVLSDGKNYLLKTKTAKYIINDGMELGSGIIQPTNNWYTNFVLEMDSKIETATNAATQSLNSSNVAKEAEVVVLQSKQIVDEKSQVVNNQFKEIQTMHKEAEQFRDEAEQFRNEAETFTPDGYANIVEQVNDTTEGIRSGFKKQAQGEEVHITDAVDGKVVEFALFGKAKQQTTQGNQLINLPDIEAVKISGINWSCKNGAVTASGTASDRSSSSMGSLYYYLPKIEAGTYFVSGSTANTKVFAQVKNSDGTFAYPENRSFSLEGNEISVMVYCQVEKDEVVDETIYPMLNKGTTALPWEPFTGGQPSPSPDYPQDIEVSGASGSVAVKSCGKNLLKNTATSKTVNGITFTVNEEDGSVIVNGTATNVARLDLATNMEIKEEMMLNGCPSGGSTTTYGIQAYIGGNKYDLGDGVKLGVGTWSIRINIYSGYTANNLVFKPMISLEGGEYQPYKETTATIPTTDFAGIKVDSGGNYTDQSGQQWICDEIVKYADGSGEYVQRVKVANITSRQWTKTGTNVDRYYRSLNAICSGIDTTLYRNIICSHFSFVQGGETVGSFTTNNENIGFAFSEKDESTVDDFNTFLDENNVFLAYILSEPIRTPLTAEEVAEIDKLNTFKPITNISNNEQCGMKITYATLQEALMLQEAYNQSRDSAQEIVDIKKELSDTTFKIETIIEKADLGIKETASGEDIHVTDSAEGKAVEFALYGKVKQNTTQGNQLFDIDKLTGTENVTYTIDKSSITISTDATMSSGYGRLAFDLPVQPDKSYTLSFDTDSTEKILVGWYGCDKTISASGKNHYSVTFTDITTSTFSVGSVVANTAIKFSNIKVEEGEVETPWEPYTGGQPSPSPDYPQEIEVSGESYNLLENTATSKTVNGVEFVVNEDKSVTVSGTNDGTVLSQLILNSDLILPYGSYKRVSHSNNVKFLIQVRNRESGTFVKTLTTLEETFLNSDWDYELYKYAVILEIAKGVTVNGETLYPMIRKASVKNDRYMPYGKGSVEVESVGKNQLNYNATTKTIKGVTFTVNADKSVSVKGTNDGTGTSDFYLIGDWGITGNIDVLPKGDLIVSGIDSNVNANGRKISLRTYVFDESGKKLGGDLELGSSLSLSKDLITSASGVAMYIVVDSNTTVDTVVYPMIRLATDTDSTYETYKETKPTIPTDGLAGIPVSSGGNYTDQIGQQWICDEIGKYADGSGESIKKFNDKILKSTDSIIKTGSTNNNMFAITVSDLKVPSSNTEKKPLLCTHFEAKNSYDTLFTNNLVGITTHKDNYIVLCFGLNEDFDTVEKVKTWLDSNEVKVYYELAEPIRTPLTAEQIAEIEKISTFYPVTNISNDFDCGMRVKYLADNKNYIDNQLSLQAQAREQEMMTMFMLLPEETQAAMIENDINNLLLESEV